MRFGMPAILGIFFIAVQNGLVLVRGFKNNKGRVPFKILYYFIASRISAK